MLQRLIEFVERLSLDEKMYWQIPRAKGSPQPVELSYERGGKPASWKVKLAEGRDWLPVRGEDLVAMLKAANADMDYAERHMGVSLLTQAVFADLYLEKVKAIFGEEVVRNSIKDARLFFKQVGEKATKLAGEAEATASVSSGGGAAPKNPLRIVRSDEKSRLH